MVVAAYISGCKAERADASIWDVTCFAHAAICAKGARVEGAHGYA